MHSVSIEKSRGIKTQYLFEFSGLTRSEELAIGSSRDMAATASVRVGLCLTSVGEGGTRYGLTGTGAAIIARK